MAPGQADPRGGRDVFSIRDLTKEFAVSARTLRFYEEKGLLALLAYGALVFVGRAPEGKGLPAVDFEDVVFTAQEDH